MILIPGNTLYVHAEEGTDEQAFVQASGIESVLEECYETEVKDNLDLYLVPTEEGEYLNMAFSDTEEYTYIRSAPDEDSDWIGKLYITIQRHRFWNIWTGGLGSGRARQKGMFLLIH